ncbi:hypothetical protein PybrP1_000006 [[Pythium] brassicae (nom. inval.)]|nr:hypothetical protein PybrP1_000006 [[Pythium] brassicae (nom. inval.)]
MDNDAASTQPRALSLDYYDHETVLSPENLPVGITAQESSPVGRILAPLPVDYLDDTNISTSSPAVTAMALTSTVSPISSVAQLTTTPPMMSDAGSVKARADRVKPQLGMNGGRWTEQEHQSFLAGLRLYGREWKKVASKIKTRTSAQIRSHAQKYFAKLARDDEMRKHNGLLPLSDSSATAYSVNSLYGYYSDGGSSPALNSGDETDSSSSQHSAVRGKLFSHSVTPTTSSQSPPAPGAANPARVSNLTGLFSSALKQQEPSQQTKKRARVAAAINATLVLQPLPTAAKPSPNGFKHRKVMVKEAGGVELLPSQEELLEKVSPTIRQRLSSLIEAELCALQVLSCSALLQQQQSSAGEVQRSPRTSSLIGYSASLSGPASAGPVAATGSPGFPASTPMARSMIATEQIPTMPSIY